ncbi:MAG: ATP-binding protein [Ignavibacteriota bacterium]
MPERSEAGGSEILLEELRKVFALEGASEDLLLWIIDHAEVGEAEDGALLLKVGDPADALWFILEGKFSFYMDVGGTLVYYLTFENDRSSGGITGLLPHSRMKVSPGNSYAIGHNKVLKLHRDHFEELEQLFPEFVQRLIGYMTERARVFATIQLQREKVSALGKLSAGIAHELNNPAAAIKRIAAELRLRLNENYDLTSKLVSGGTNSTQIEVLRTLVSEKESMQQRPASALEKMGREDEITDWFSAKGFSEDRQSAETFADFGFRAEDLEKILLSVEKNTFGDMLRWVENILTSDRLIKDLAEASERISKLVGAIKSHVHMDRADASEPTNIHTDIENTLTLMGYKLRDKNITVTREFSEDMPPVEAFVGELNQVWTNMIDNAIDAMPRNGELAIQTCAGKRDVTIRLVDSGSGIPNDIVSRIFDPFFTTKKVGDGTGIGLDIVKKIIDKHHGEIKVNSAPGRTEFVICLPQKQPKPAGEAATETARA